ncbi:MAG: hypothetical protein H7A51_08910 [Akkermansiaceae bacterium]|nr:hypothetical protein [Akkermansiaceae bacterium]
MKDADPNKPELRVLPEVSSDDGLERLPRPEPGRPQGRYAATGEGALPQEQASDAVEVLRPDHKARVNAKSLEPDVAEIMDHDGAAVSSEDGWGVAVKKAPPLGWFVLAGMLICGLAMWAAVTVFKAEPERKVTEAEKKELVIDKIKETKEVRQTLNAMRSCVSGYLTATSIDEKLAFVRHPERVRPLMEHYYQTHPMKAESFRQFERIRSMGLETLSFVYGQVELKNGKKYKLLLEQLEDGTFKVDWESDVCYLPVPWDEYLSGEVKKPMVMRVFIKRDTFFAYEFRDEAMYDCYQLTARDSDDHLFGFVKKGSETAMDINRFIGRVKEHGGNDREPIMLEIRFPDDTRSKKCVVIDRMVAPRWTYVKSPEADEGSDQ